jgi:hypothetical protein
MWSIAHSAYSREHAVVISVDEVATGAADRRLGAAASSARSRRAAGRPGTGALGGQADAEPGEGDGYGSGRWPYRWQPQRDVACRVAAGRGLEIGHRCDVCFLVDDSAAIPPGAASEKP